MHPEIISFGPLAIRSYGLFLAIGFMTGIMFAARRARLAGENPDHLYNISIWLVVSALLGARIYYVATHYSEFAAPGYGLPMRVLLELKRMFWPVGESGQVGINGLVLYGGFMGATAAAVYYLRRHHLNTLRYMDIMAPSLGLGIFFTRIGCFLNGCCFGKPTDLPIGVHFPADSAASFYYPGMAVHPSQLYQSAGGLIIFFILLALDRHKRFDGFTAMSFFLLYSVDRFIIDYFRYYESSLTFFGLSHNQLLSIVVFLVAAILMWKFSRRAGARS
jgi:phosphatidylglycerol---prolipoprotein diacylglyceryl transferase